MRTYNVRGILIDERAFAKAAQLLGWRGYVVGQHPILPTIALTNTNL